MLSVSWLPLYLFFSNERRLIWSTVLRVSFLFAVLVQGWFALSTLPLDDFSYPWISLDIDLQVWLLLAVPFPPDTGTTFTTTAQTFLLNSNFSFIFLFDFF